LKLNPDNVYDPLAKEYDAILHADPQNKVIRDHITSLSLKYISTTSTSMDFGGGTGHDLSWLSEHSAKVLFCEPSVNMRFHAEELIKNKRLENVTVMEDTDFKAWDFEKTLPKKESVNFVLSNFAVFNSIYEIDILFAQLSACMAQDGILIVCLLHGFPEDYKGLKVFKKVLNKIRFGMAEKSFVLKNHAHNTIIHTHKKITSASEPQFDCILHDKLLNSMFTLYTFKKK
jgi:SAM-dependent methyltransferase